MYGIQFFLRSFLAGQHICVIKDNQSEGMLFTKNLFSFLFGFILLSPFTYGNAAHSGSVPFPTPP